MERELCARFGHEYALTVAVAYAILDQVFSVGGELQFEVVDHRGTRFDADEYELLIGPSLQWRPTPPVHLDLVGLLGTGVVRGHAGAASKRRTLVQPTFVLGYEL